MNLEELSTELHDAALEIPGNPGDSFSQILGRVERVRGLRKERFRFAIKLSGTVLSVDEDDHLGQIFLEDITREGESVIFSSGTGTSLRILPTSEEPVSVRFERAADEYKYPFGRWRRNGRAAD